MAAIKAEVNLDPIAWRNKIETRRKELEVLVDRALARLGEGASQASLPPMSSYERKLVHDIVADRGFVSESYGEGADRHTVIRRG